MNAKAKISVEGNITMKEYDSIPELSPFIQRRPVKYNLKIEIKNVIDKSVITSFGRREYFNFTLP
ncbi:hypothetical protein [Microbulbifer epialgicus]|uniref:hypothetical protein n=1 Tax=Microbulbifer epialgicus TaxID=393907 RepID=UPI00353089E8